MFVSAIAALFGMLLVAGAVVMLSVWLALLLWQPFGPSVLAVFAGVYLLTGWALLAWVLRRMRTQPPLLESTIAELRRDAALLRATPPGPAAPVDR